MENPETLAEVTVASKAQVLEEGTVEVGSGFPNESLTGSRLPSEVLLGRVEVNGVRTVDESEGVISVPDKGKKDGILATRVLGDGGTRMASASSEFIENGKEFGFDRETVKRNATVEDGSSVNEKGSGGALLKEELSTRLNGSDSAENIKDSGHSSSIVFGVQGSGDLLSDNGENPGSEVLKMTVSLGETKKNNNVEGMEEKEVDGEEEDQVANEHGHKFSIGDFVWAELKSHPWWPGLICDPSDSPKHAAKSHRRDHLLVRYFGNGNFAWCFQSQLKPFQENFELMSNQNNSKRFCNAVKEAVNEIGKHVELEMTCLCVPQEFRNRLARPLAVKAGIREGVVVPDSRIGELRITLYEPAKLLALLRDVAEVVSVNSVLELTVLRSHLSAFFRAKGYWQLPMYHEAEDVSGTEECAVIEETHKTIGDDLSKELTLYRTEVDCLSSAASHGVIKPCQASSQRWPGSADNKSHQRKKQKSMAELLAGEVDVEHRNGYSDAAGEILSDKPASTSKKKTENSENEINIGAEDSTGSMGLQTKKLNNSKLLVSPPTADKEISSITNDDRVAKAPETSSSPRVRKRSKYLSPPYVDLIWGNKGVNSSKDSEAESPKAEMVSSVEESMNRAADQLAGSPSAVSYGGQTSQRKPSKDGGVRKKSSYLIPQTPNSVNYMNVSMDDNAFSDEMFSDFLTISLNPYHLDGTQRFDTLKSFFSRFRRSLYCNESVYMMVYEELVVQSGRRRKSLDKNPGSSGRASHAIDHHSSEPESIRKEGETEKAFSQNTKNELQQVDITSSLKMDLNKDETKVDSSAAKQSGGRRKSSGSNQGLSGQASQATNQSGKRRKSLENNPCSSGLASQAIGHQSSEPKPKRKREKTVEAFPQNAKSELQQVDIISGFKMDLNKEETKDESSAAVQASKATSHLSSGQPNAGNELQQVDVTSGLKMDLNKEETKDKSSAAVQASQAPAHQSSGPKPKRKRRKKAEVISPNTNGELQQVNVTLGLKMDLNKEETRDESSAAVEASQAPALQSSEPKPKRKRRKKAEVISPNTNGELQQVDVTLGLKMDLNKEETRDESSAAVEASQATALQSSEPKPKRKRRGKTVEASSRNAKSKLQQIDVTSGLKLDLNKGDTKNQSSAVSLHLTFAPGFSLPSKDDLFTIFGRFGSLNEGETGVLGDSNCARVAFMRNSDAEEAYNSSLKVSPFGNAVINYRLHYSSPVSGAPGLDGSTYLQPTPLLIEGKETSASPSASRLLPVVGEAPPLVFIKQNLQMMTSMLENSGDKLSPKVKAKLEAEIKCLLNKLSTMDESSSS